MMRRASKQHSPPAKAGAIVTLTTTNTALVATNATLTAEVKKLTADIARLKAQVRVPPGQDKDDPGGTAQQAKNTLGKMCAVRKGGEGQTGNLGQKN